MRELEVAQLVRDAEALRAAVRDTIGDSDRPEPADAREPRGRARELPALDLDAHEARHRFDRHVGRRADPVSLKERLRLATRAPDAERGYARAQRC